MNIFFGVSVNAARGIAHSVENAIMGFVNNFLSAVYPQITKLYASGNEQEMQRLVCRSSKFAYFLLLVLALPVYIETEYVLSLWLGFVPDFTVIFFRLTILSSALSALGNTSNCACQATGNVKNFSFVIAMISLCVFPLTFICYKIGLSAEYAYIVYITIYSFLIVIRMYFLKKLVNLDPVIFVKTVLVPALVVTCLSCILPLLVHHNVVVPIVRFVSVFIFSIFSTCFFIYFIGLTFSERLFLFNALKRTCSLLKLKTEK